MKCGSRMLLLCLAAALPSGCERASAERGAAPLAAKVNGTEIGLRQVRAAAGQSAGQALEKVIERELLVQQALHAGLERDPQIVESIDNARRQILAQAWIERRAAAAQKATREEIHAFYDQNPALFAERRIYRLRELTVSAPPELTDVLRAEASAARDLEQVAAWLQARGARFGASTVALPAEQLPLSQLPQIARMKEGEIAVFGAPGGASVIQLLHGEDAALSEQQAAPLIEQFLAGRKKLELAAAEVKRLREAATIEYAGDFKAR